MQSALPPCVGFAKDSPRTEKPAAASSPCFPFQDNICAAQTNPKLNKRQQSCRKCQQLEQQELQRPQQAEQSQQAELPQPLPEQQQATENTCRGLSSSLDNQLMGYLESIVEIMLAKKASSLQNQDEQLEQSCIGLFGVVPVQQAQQNDQQNFDSSSSNTPQLIPHCACTGILPTSGQTASLRSSAISSQPVPPDRSPRTSTGSAAIATESQSSAVKCCQSCYLPKKEYLENGAPSSYNDMETQTTFNSCPTCPTRSHVWHRPRCSHCFWYPTKIQR